MCGAYSLIADFDKLSKRFNAKPPRMVQPPRYNIRPSQPLATILNADPEQIVRAQWGIVPYWDKTGKKLIINARADSLEKPTFKRSFQERRCLILADSFYEWKNIPGQKGKVPYRFALQSEEPFAFAGIWQIENQEPRAVIITTIPNKIVEDVHDRMPVILKREFESDWLNPDLDPFQALEMLRPYQHSEMKAYPLSTLVNSPGNDRMDIIASAL